jgi:hypothetical protein
VSVDVLFDEVIYTLPDGQDVLLAANLRSYASGSHPDEVAKVIKSEAAGLHWTDGAPQLAGLIEEALADRRGGPVAIEGEAIETLRAGLGLSVQGTETSPAPGPAELLAVLRELDCKVCWGLGWMPWFAVSASDSDAGDSWRACRRCLRTGRRSQTGPQRARPSEPPQRHRPT